MSQPNLKLFRRHETTCAQGYPKDFRVYQMDARKAKGQEREKGHGGLLVYDLRRRHPGEGRLQNLRQAEEHR